MNKGYDGNTNVRNIVRQIPKRSRVTRVYSLARLSEERFSESFFEAFLYRYIRVRHSRRLPLLSVFDYRVGGGTEKLRVFTRGRDTAARPSCFFGHRGRYSVIYCPFRRGPVYKKLPRPCSARYGDVVIYRGIETRNDNDVISVYTSRLTYTKGTVHVRVYRNGKD